jgi:hypothetical protein
MAVEKTRHAAIITAIVDLRIRPAVAVRVIVA